MRIVTPPKTWAYAAELPLTIPPDARGGIRVRIRARVVCGEAGLGVLHRNEKSFQHRKFLRAGGAEEETIFLRVEDPLEARSVIIENATPTGRRPRCCCRRWPWRLRDKARYSVKDYGADNSLIEVCGSGFQLRMRRLTGSRPRFC